MKRFLIPVLFILFVLPAFSQQDNVLPILKEIEAGNLESAQSQFDQIKFKHKDEPGIIFVEGLLTVNADNAVKHFTKVYKNHPKSGYADASVFRIYSYYVATGEKASSDKFLNILKTEYPKSPYLAGITKNQPIALTENKESSKSSSSMKTAIKESFYSLQAGAFSVIKNALVLKDQLARAGWTVEIREKIVGGANFFIVYAGSFGTEAEAKSAKEKLNESQKVESRVVSLEK